MVSRFDTELPTLSSEQVMKRITEMKKKTSSVPGDLPLIILKEHGELIILPITHIFNQITQQKKWPKAWRTEHMTIITKGRDSDEPAKCRNISCTNFLSKAYESFVLEWSRAEARPKNNQYWGNLAAEHHTF